MAFLLAVLSGKTALAQQSSGNSLDSLAALYVSAVSAGNKIIVDQGAFKALFSADGTAITPFFFTHLKAGLGGDFVAQQGNRFLLLDAMGREKGRFRTAITQVDTLRQQYESTTGNTRFRYNAEATEISGATTYGGKTPPDLYGWMQEPEGLWGVKDTFGKTVLPAVYDRIWSITRQSIVVQKADSVLVFSAAGRLLFKCRGDEAKALSPGLTAVRLLGLWGIKDVAGKQLTGYVFNEVKTPGDNDFFIEADDTILDSAGRKLGAGSYSYISELPGNWLNLSLSGSIENEIRDEHFRLVFPAGDWDREAFIGTRFIHLFRGYTEQSPKIYDRKTGQFTDLLVESALTEETYVIYDAQTRERKILKGDAILPLPRFTKIEGEKWAPFFKITDEGRKGKTFLEPDRRADWGEISKIEKDSSLKGLLDSNMQVVIPPTATAVQVLSGNLVASYTEKDSVSRLYSNTGKLLFELPGGATAIRFPLFVQAVSKERALLLDTSGRLFFKGVEAPELLYTDATKEYQNTLPDLLLYDDSSGYSGLYNLEGTRLLPHQYYQVAQKVPGLFSLKKGDSVYFVNTRGKLLFGGRGFRSNDYYVLEGYGILMQNEDRKWGVLGADGTPVLAFEYDSLALLQQPQMPAEYVLGKAGKWALLDNTGQLRYPLQDWKPVKNAGLDMYAGSDSGFYKTANGAALKTTAGAAWLETYKAYNTGRLPCFFEVYGGGALPAGIYNQKMQRVNGSRVPYQFNSYEPLLLLADSGLKYLSAIDTAGNTIIPPQLMPAGIVANGGVVALLYPNGKDLLFRRQNGVYKKEAIHVDSTFRAHFTRREKLPEVMRYRALSFTAGNGPRGVIARLGGVLFQPAGTVFYPNDYAWRVKQGHRWGLLHPDTFQYIHPLKADSIADDPKRPHLFTIFQSGKQGLYNGNLRSYLPPEHLRILSPETLERGFVVAQDAAGYTILDRQGRQVAPYLDSLSGVSYSLLNAIGISAGEEVSLRVTEGGTIALLRGAQARIKREGIGGNTGAAVIITVGKKQGLWSNKSFEMVLPADYDMIQVAQSGNAFTAWKYKANKHEGIDSTLLLDADGKRLFGTAGGANPKEEDGFWYFKDAETAPVFNSAGKEIVPAGHRIDRSDSKHFFLVEKGGLWGIISNNGEWLLPLQFDGIAAAEYNDTGFFTGEKEVDDEESLYCLINAEGKILTKTIYSEIRFTDTAILFKRKRTYGYLDMQGKETVKPWPEDEMEDEE